MECIGTEVSGNTATYGFDDADYDSHRDFVIAQAFICNNLKPTSNKRAVRVLDENELNHYEVSVFGNKHLLVDIWNDYLENKDGDSRKWLTSQKDPQTNQAIKQLLDQYNLKKRISEIENDGEDDQAEKQAVKGKPKQSDQVPSNSDDIKQLVDGDNDNKTPSDDAEFDAMNLF